jgi:hypothetical protein
MEAVRRSSLIKTVWRNYGPADLGRAVLDVCRHDLKSPIINFADRIVYGRAVVLGPNGLTIPRVDPKTLVNKGLMSAVLNPPTPPLGPAAGGGAPVPAATPAKPNLQAELETNLKKAQPLSKISKGLIITGCCLASVLLGLTALGGALGIGLPLVLTGPVVYYLLGRKATQAKAKVRAYIKVPETKELLVQHLAGLKDEKPALALFGRKQRNELAGLVATARRLNTERQITETAKAAAAAKAARPLNEKVRNDDWPEVVALTKGLLDALDSDSPDALPGNKSVLTRSLLAIEERLLQLEEQAQPDKPLGSEQAQAKGNLTALRIIILEKLG